MKKIYSHIGKNIGSGIPMLIIAGFFLFFVKAFFSGMDEAVQKMFSFIPGVELNYPGLGILLTFPIAYILGLMLKRSFIKKILVGIIKRVPLAGPTIGALIESFSGKMISLPILEIEYPSEGLFEKGWLMDVRPQKVRSADGTEETIVSYTCFLPTSNNPTSGRVVRVFAERIKYVLEGPSNQLLMNIIFFGRVGNDWKRRRFNPDEFPPSGSYD